jgi:hypothetical protein
MSMTTTVAVATAVTCAAVGLASPALAEEQELDGDYTLVDGATTNTWNITTRCNAERTCGGTVSTSTGWVGAINRLAGGPWTAQRDDVPNAWTCADGTTGPADLAYSFDPASLMGTATYTSKPGACNQPTSAQIQQPVSLQPETLPPLPNTLGSIIGRVL